MSTDVRIGRIARLARSSDRFDRVLMDAWIVVEGDTARLTEHGWATVDRAHAAFGEGDSVEQIVSDEGLPSSKHLQLLIAVAEQSGRP